MIISMPGMMNKLAKEIHAISVAKGFYDPDRQFPEIIALIHSELSEALEAYRERRDEDIPEELADTIIRILDWCAHQGIDIERAIERKMTVNRSRSYRHGNKRC